MDTHDLNDAVCQKMCDDMNAKIIKKLDIHKYQNMVASFNNYMDKMQLNLKILMVYNLHKIYIIITNGNKNDLTGVFCR